MGADHHTDGELNTWRPWKLFFDHVAEGLWLKILRPGDLEETLKALKEFYRDRYARYRDDTFFDDWDPSDIEVRIHERALCHFKSRIDFETNGTEEFCRWI